VLRITPGTDDAANTLKLEGKLSGPWVEELERCWYEMRRDKRAPVKLNLKEVSFSDARGKDLLLRMERQGVSLVDCPRFIRQLLGPGGGIQKRNSNEKVEEN
jgi:hypothetical protein